MRPTPDAAGKFDVFFNVGSQYNNQPATHPTVGLNASGAVRFAGGTMHGASIYKVTIQETADAVEVTDLTQIASGLRCAAGMAFDPRTGDLWFQENGIDDVSDPHTNFSADELNRIALRDIGGVVEDFGFPESYVRAADGVVIGKASHRVAFMPIDGGESEGASEIAFAPPTFPPGLRGIFVGFHGRFSANGVENEENPVIHFSPGSGKYVHFIDVRQPQICHPNGVLATEDSLFIADMGNFMSGFNTGAIYQIRPVQ